MANSSPTTWRHSNQYHAEAVCDHCGQMLQHQAWCVTINPFVHYAYQVILDPSKLTIGDTLILHSLGVVWEGRT